MNPDQTAPLGSSLIRVHIVCNIDYQITFTNEQADDNSCEWREKSCGLYHSISQCPEQFVCVDALHPSQQIFNYVGMIYCLPQLKPVQSSG